MVYVKLCSVLVIFVGTWGYEALPKRVGPLRDSIDVQPSALCSHCTASQGNKTYETSRASSVVDAIHEDEVYLVAVSNSLNQSYHPGVVREAIQLTTNPFFVLPREAMHPIPIVGRQSSKSPELGGGRSVGYRVRPYPGI